MPGMTRTTLAAGLLAAVMAACGGGGDQEMAEDQAADAAAPAPMMPDWMTVDTATRTVNLTVVAGQTAVNNHWNFNGYFNGDATITVPQGYTVRVTFRNQDPAMAHSLAIVNGVGGYAPQIAASAVAFAGAVTANPGDLTAATQPGRSETISFTAGAAGDYGMVCLIPAHAVAGMWIRFAVSADGSFGVSTT